MGNKHSRSKSETDASETKRSKKGIKRNSSKASEKGVKTDPNKHLSMPDLGGAKPYKPQKENEDVKFTLHRSYRDLDRSKSMLGTDTVDYKIYRKSTSGIPDKPTTLPRNFGRSKSAINGSHGPVRNATTPNGTIDPGFPDVFNRDRAYSAGKGSMKLSKRGSRASSFNSAFSQFLPSDFPTTDQIKSKISKFEELYTRNLVSKFTSLPEDRQISCVVIARDSEVKKRRISLKEYMAEETVVPENLLAEEFGNRFQLTIPESLFHGISHVRSEKKYDINLISSLARDIVSCVATEAANELSRIYEYQISLMYDELSIKIIAEHAVDCVIEYIQSHYLDRNSAIRSVIQVYPPNEDGQPKLIAGVLGNKEIKWDLYELFKKPGLRKELLLVSDEVMNESVIDFQPWQYYRTGSSEPFVYGYRGQMITWDFIDKEYKLDEKENESYKEEVLEQPEDYHRLYMPYKRLFGTQVMQRYCNQTSGNQLGLVEFLKTSPLDGPPERDEILPVYRPLSSKSATFDFRKANLNNSDLTRVKLSKADLKSTSVRNSKLLMADLDNAKLDALNMAGSDVSYSNLNSTEGSPDDLKAVRARHVLLNESFSYPSDTQHRNGINGHHTGVENDEFLENGNGVGTPKPKLNFVSDGDGNFMPVNEAIDQLETRMKEEEKKKQEEQLRKSEVSITITQATPVNGEPAKKSLKKRKKKKRIDELNALNQSVDSTGQASVTDYNFLEDGKILESTPNNNNNTKRINGKEQITDECVTSFFSPAEAGITSVKAATPPSVVRRAGPRHEEVNHQRAISTLEYQTESKSSSHILSGDYIGYNNNNISRPIGSRYSSVETRPLRNRIVKSQSLHGNLTTQQVNGVQNIRGSTYLSTKEMESIRKSQIFNMLSVLQVDPIKPSLPVQKFQLYGRDEQILDIADMVSGSGRVVMLTGCPGVGKSALACAVGQEMMKKEIIPVHLDLLQCSTVEGVWQRMMVTFDLHFKVTEAEHFYQWLNSHEQKLIFILDNTELDQSLDMDLSAFIDNLLFNVKNLRVLSTSHRQFFRGQATHETYRVGDVRPDSAIILRQFVPDLHDEGIDQLVAAVDHILYGIYLVGQSFSIPDVDSGKLFEDLSSSKCSLISRNRMEDTISKFTTNEIEQQRLMKLFVIIGTIFEHMPRVCSTILKVAHVIPSYFTVGALKSIFSFEEGDTMKNLDMLVRGGLLVKTNDCYILPKVVKLVASTIWPDDGKTMELITQHYVNKVKELNAMYHSNESYKAMKETIGEYNNIVAVLKWLIEHEDTYEYCSSWADMDYAIFLCEYLPQNLYDDLYECLSQQAGDNDDIIVRTNALSCSSYRCMIAARYENARAYAENAYETVHAAQVSELDKAFCVQCLGKAYWHDEEKKQKGMALIKCSLDIYKAKYGLKHVKALYSNEEYGKVLTEVDSHQKARHIFNVSDLILSEMLECHPYLIQSYNCRRIIWDKLFLFSRSTEIAEKAVKTARMFYGDHPITAAMLSNQCDCIMKRGSLQDGLKTAIDALGIRIRVLGDHMDTAASYKIVAHMMMRCGQFDEALKFGQCALDIYERIHAPEKAKMEVKTLLAQVQYRLEKKEMAAKFVEIDVRNGSNSDLVNNNQEQSSKTRISSSAISTAV